MRNRAAAEEPSRPPLVGGVEAGGQKFVCAIGRGPDDLHAETRIPTSSAAETIAHVIAFFAAHASRSPLAAIGIASFGPLDLRPGSRAFGWITTTPKPGWAQTDLAGPLREPWCLDRELGGHPVGVAIHHQASVIGKNRAPQVIRIDVAHAVALELELAVDRAQRNVRVNHRAEVVLEAGQRRLLGMAAAADARRALQPQHLGAGLGEIRRAGEPVVSGADHDEVMGHPSSGPATQ